MAHKTVEDCFLTAGNKNAWNKEKGEILNIATRKYLSAGNRQERPRKEKDLRKNATPIAANPSFGKIELLSYSSFSRPYESGVSSKSSVSSKSGDSSSENCC